MTITQAGPGIARLFGVPFIVVGGYFLYQFLDGVLHPGELTIAGWILLPLMTAAFLVPGWLITMFRKRATIDATAREVSEEYDFLVYTHRTKTSIPSNAHILMRYERGSERRTRGAFFTSVRTGFLLPVYLTAGKREVLLALFGDREKPAALTFAQRVATFLRIDVQDRCVEGGEVTSGGVVVAHADDEDP